MKPIGQIFILILVILISACSDREKLQRYSFFGDAQGTYYTVTYYAKDEKVSKTETDSLLRSFDLVASLWISESIISKVNNNQMDLVDDEHFVKLFNISKEVSEITDGAFDFTIGQLVSAWGFSFRNKIEINQHVIDSLKQFTGYEKVDLINGRIVKNHPNIQFDFNAVAQGYSVDLTGAFLEAKGLENFLVDIGGEVLAKGKKPDGSLWIVGIEQPSENSDSKRNLKATLAITDKAVATSGNYRKYFEKDGIRYSHTIDPKTGYPVQHTLLSATVMAGNAAIADAYATAFMVMGLEKSLEFIQKQSGLDAYFIYSDENGELQTKASERIKEMIKEGQ
jgi:FAD:protein FMN transferase